MQFHGESKCDPAKLILDLDLDFKKRLKIFELQSALDIRKERLKSSVSIKQRKKKADLQTHRHLIVQLLICIYLGHMVTYKYRQTYSNYM